MTPLLSDDDLQLMRVRLERCVVCGSQILRNYCRECDEFFEYNHYPRCERDPRQQEKHKGHQTY